MKKRSLLLLTYGLALSLSMFNCKKDKETDIEAPPTGVIDDIDKITLPDVTVDPPATVTVVESKIEVSAQSAALASGLSSIGTSGEVPAAITAAAGSVSAALSPAEVATLSAVTPAAIAAVAAGGTLAPEVKAVMDKVAADPALKAYIPVITLPSVGGVSVGARIGAVEQVSLIEVSDACLKVGQDAFDKKKGELDTKKTTEDAKVTAAYQTVIAPYAAAETTCKTNVGTKYTAIKAGVNTQVTASLGDLEGAKAILGEATYSILHALVNISGLSAYDAINTLVAADNSACTEIKNKNLAAAEAARVANLAKVTAAYTTALNEATAARNVALAACHNQGSGN